VIARPTSSVVLAALIAVGFVGGWLTPPMLTRLDLSTPRLGWTSAVMLLLAAMVVGRFAWAAWQSLHKRGERMTSAYAIKLLAMAKSCALVAALVGGYYAGFALAFADALDSMLGRERFWQGLAAAGACLALLVASLLLERACKLPQDPDDDEGVSAQQGSA
jgi:hypothetical protein